MQTPRKISKKPSSIPFILYRSAAGSNYTGVGEPPHRTDTCNVVIFGEAGAGKSSLVNLIAGTNMAATSPDAGGCTTGINMHEILIQNEMLKVRIFDTPGLDEGPRGTVPDDEARKILKNLLVEQDDIHLIMYCVRGERVIQTLRRNYQFIRSQVKRKVPIVLVITCLESYEPEMEEWWRVNEQTISKAGMTFAGHACVTTAMMTGPKVTERRRRSYIDVCKLIEQCPLSNDDTGVHAEPLRGTVHNFPSKMAASRKNIVLFGQAGAGKSSVVNLMAGEQAAPTSMDLKSCTLRWQEYSITFDGGSYNVFDTVGLEEPQLGIPQFLDAVENAYRLIQKLETQGGIDLLLFCMRAGRLTSTVQNNYRLFHEFLCDKKVPIILVITYLEHEVGEMDDWWKRNDIFFRDREVDVVGHACITAIRGNFPRRHEESRITIRNIVRNYTADGQRQAWQGGDNWFASFMPKMMELLVGNRKSVRMGMISCLTKRCGMSLAVANQLVDRIKEDVVTSPVR